jgi:uncharacterized protein (TIGR02118 family)
VTNIEAFEKIYLEEHVPLAVAKLTGKTKIVATKITSSPQGTPPFYRIAEIHFPSKAALEACAATPGAREALAHAVNLLAISGLADPILRTTYGSIQAMFRAGTNPTGIRAISFMDLMSTTETLFDCSFAT